MWILATLDQSPVEQARPIDASFPPIAEIFPRPTQALASIRVDPKLLGDTLRTIAVLGGEDGFVDLEIHRTMVVVRHAKTELNTTAAIMGNDGVRGRGRSAKESEPAQAVSEESTSLKGELPVLKEELAKREWLVAELQREVESLREQRAKRPVEASMSRRERIARLLKRG